MLFHQQHSHSLPTTSPIKVNKFQHCPIEIGHAHALDDASQPKRKKNWQALKVAAVQEHEEAVSQRHVDLC